MDNAEPRKPNAYERAVQAREAAKNRKSTAAEEIGEVLTEFLRREGFPVTVKSPDPSGIVGYHLEIEGEEIEIYPLKGSLKIDGRLGPAAGITLVPNAEQVPREAINRRVCDWLCKRIANQ